MPAFSQGLEKALHQALTLANERHHEYATLEHLLLALIDDSDAVGATHRREAVGDNDHRATAHQPFERLLDDELGAWVEVGRRFVEHEH